MCIRAYYCTVVTVNKRFRDNSTLYFYFRLGILMTDFEKKRIPPEAFGSRAEEIQKNNRIRSVDKSIANDVDTLIQELHSHQIVLELQNEELRKAQAELGLSHQRFRELYDFAPVGYFSLDKHGRILDVNKTGARMLDIYRARLVHRDLRSFVIDQERDRFDKFIRLLGAEGQEHSCDIRLSLTGNRVMHVRVNGVELADEERPSHLFVTFTDVSEQKRAEAELARMRDELGDRVKMRTAELSETVGALENEIEERKSIEDQLRLSREKLRQLSRKTMAMLESDRKNVAKEIHDSLGGSLAAIKFRLEDSLTRFDDEDAEMNQVLLQTIEYIQDTIKDTKRISASLRPTTLDDLGLQPTIKWFCRHLMEINPEISIVTRIDLNEKEVEESLKIVIFRIVQEAMTNAVQHSEADTVWLTLTQQEQEIELEIKDNGCGFDTGKMFSETLEALAGYGIASIRERAEICGGTFKIESFIDSGTNIHVRLPNGNAAN